METQTDRQFVPEEDLLQQWLHCESLDLPCQQTDLPNTKQITSIDWKEQILLRFSWRRISGKRKQKHEDFPSKKLMSEEELHTCFYLQPQRTERLQSCTGRFVIGRFPGFSPHWGNIWFLGFLNLQRPAENTRTLESARTTPWHEVLPGSGASVPRLAPPR